MQEAAPEGAHEPPCSLLQLLGPFCRFAGKFKSSPAFQKQRALEIQAFQLSSKSRKENNFKRFSALKDEIDNSTIFVLKTDFIDFMTKFDNRFLPIRSSSKFQKFFIEKSIFFRYFMKFWIFQKFRIFKKIIFFIIFVDFRNDNLLHI